MLRTLLLLTVLLVQVPAATVLCLGDSLTAGYGLSETEAWPARIQEALAARGVTVLNAGRSGDTSAGGRQRLAWSLKAKPDVVIVALGGNDALRGLPATDLEANLMAIVRACQQAGARVLIAGMRAPTSLGAEYGRAFDAVYPRVAAATGAALLPFLLEGVALDPSLNLADGIHPNGEGHRRVAALVLPALTPLLEPVHAAP